MTLKNISNEKNDLRKVEFVVIKDNTIVFTNWYKNWKCFVRTAMYKKMVDRDLEYCIIKYFNEMPYISVCVNL